MRSSPLARAAAVSLASLASLAALLLPACSSTATPAGSDGGVTPAGDAATPVDAAEPGPVGGERPVTVHVPPGYKPGVPAPLIVMLHGYGASGLVEEIYLGLKAVADTRGFLYVNPDGKSDTNGKRFWNSTYACCDFGKTGVDDTAYISGLIKEIQAQYSVDPKRIFLVGHSNGGFMSHRLACARSEQIAAIVSLAGSMGSEPSQCAPTQPVSVLQIHGTKDNTIAYAGGDLGGGSLYPGAEAVVSAWAKLDGCGPTPDTSAPPLDLDSQLAGPETKVTRYTGCKPGGAAELWAIQDGSHIPSLSATFTTQVVDFLFAHPKP